MDDTINTQIIHKYIKWIKNTSKHRWFTRHIDVPPPPMALFSEGAPLVWGEISACPKGKLIWCKQCPNSNQRLLDHLVSWKNWNCKKSRSFPTKSNPRKKHKQNRKQSCIAGGIRESVLWIKRLKNIQWGIERERDWRARKWECDENRIRNQGKQWL